jgi:hypothetical protein
MDWARILAFATGMVDQELLARIEYLAAENRILDHRLTDAFGTACLPISAEPTTLATFTPIRQVFQSDGQSAIWRFESSQPSQPVRSPPANVRRRIKTALYRGILRIPLGLRVGNWAREEAFRRLVSEAIFWCLVFAGPIGHPADISCVVLCDAVRLINVLRLVLGAKTGFANTPEEG